MALRFPRRYTFCEHIGQHVAIPHQAVQEAARAYDLAGQWHSVRDLDQRILQGGHINQAARHRRRVDRIKRADIIRGCTVRVERVGDGIGERRYLLEQGARLL